MLIAHASADLSKSDVGLFHALALTATQSGERRVLTLHVEDETSNRPRTQLKQWLKRWRLPEDHVQQTVHTVAGYKDRAEGILSACKVFRPDLLVLPTHARSGVARVFDRSVAEAVASNLTIPSLILPFAGHRLVDESSGEVMLARLLVLGGTSADAQLGVDAAAWFTREFRRTETQVALLHVHDGSPFPEAEHPELRLRLQYRSGELVDSVVQTCAEQQPQLLVMVSHGHDQLRDVLFANRTERVIHAVQRPLLWIPPTFVPPKRAADEDNTSFLRG